MKKKLKKVARRPVKGELISYEISSVSDSSLFHFVILLKVYRSLSL